MQNGETNAEPFAFGAPIKSIAIIGAGSCGIVLAKAALAEGFTSITIFEQRSDIGGAWLYTSETSSPRNIPSTNAFNFDEPLPGTPPTLISPMYTNLFANTPRDAMTYAEKPFPSDAPAFPFRIQILKYLQEYGEDIRHLVKFNIEVLKVDKYGKWSLTIRDLTEPSKKPWIEQFDAVAVASGHYDIPLIPDIPGIDSFSKSKISHAKYFRHPSIYKNQNLLLVGNGPSGADLANQLLHYARSVQRSVRSEPNALAVTNPKVRDILPIKCFHSDSIELLDGSVLSDIDKVIFCTGYLYSLPMFTKESGFITPDGLYVHHLYDQTFYCEDPTLVFLGLPKQVIPFPTFQNQAIVVAKIWAQKLTLPSRETMRKEEMTRLQQKNFEGSQYHSFKFPEDVELAEHWRKWAEMDKSKGWEKRMKPWRWTKEKVEFRKTAPKIKARFLEEIEGGKWDHLQLHKA